MDTLPSGVLLIGGFRSALICFQLSLSCPFRLLHTFPSLRPARHYPRFWIRRSSSERRRDLNPHEQRAAQHTLCPLLTSAAPVRTDRSTLSLDSETNGRSPEVSSTAFSAHPPDLQPVSLMDMGFAVISQFARHRMPLIRFLYIGSRLCSSLPSDPPSPERPCASLLLHLH
jgi:hypothetical protein